VNTDGVNETIKSVRVNEICGEMQQAKYVLVSEKRNTRNKNGTTNLRSERNLKSEWMLGNDWRHAKQQWQNEGEETSVFKPVKAKEKAKSKRKTVCKG